MEYITEDERIYLRDAADNLLAEVTFPVREGVANINHTYVHDSLRGQGIASELVQRAVDKIMADGNRLAASCRYAALWLERHPEYLK